jgi:phage-related protein
VITFVVDGLSNVFNDVGDKLKEIGDSAWQTFKDIDWLGLGSDIVQGIIDGVWNVASDLWGTMQDLAEGALQTAEEWLGIGSPSKVFRDSVGQWIPLGIAEGIDDQAGAVTGAMQGIAEDSVNAFNPDPVGITPTASGAGAGIPGGVTIPINVYASEGMDVVQLANKVSDVLSLQMRQAQSVWGIA